MKFDPQKHHRHSIRLKGYNYASEGAYYVTIVTQGRECLFGEIVDGEIVQKWWNDIGAHFPNVETGAFVIMPNHVHRIMFITNKRRGEVISPRNDPNQNNSFINQDLNEIQGGETLRLRKRTLGQIIADFRYQSTKEMNLVDDTGTITKLWQRNYYEHIIRNEKI
jgi:putative transposase